MREILFRGKRLDNGEWVEGDLQQFNPYGWNHEVGESKRIWIIADEGANGGTKYEVDPATVGQYTGLTDKNGKRIFEGDILDHHVQGKILVNRGVVNWDERNGRWAHKLNTMNPCFYMHNPAAFEIIGNIHDNPELLEGGADNG